MVETMVKIFPAILICIINIKNLSLSVRAQMSVLFSQFYDPPSPKRKKKKKNTDQLKWKLFTLKAMVLIPKAGLQIPNTSQAARKKRKEHEEKNKLRHVWKII